jgi:ABC-type amino acid transport substrate-binding protein
VIFARSFLVKAAAFALITGALASPSNAQQSPGLASQTELRVCADPSNLPFSNQQREGFENKIAALLAHDLNLTLSYTWFPDSQGFVRATLMKHRCDVVIGTVAGVDDMATTDAYYHTTYVMLTRLSDNITTDKVSDWKIAGRRFGIIAGTPPTNLIVDHNLMDLPADGGHPPRFAQSSHGDGYRGRSRGCRAVMGPARRFLHRA